MNPLHTPGIRRLRAAAVVIALALIAVLWPGAGQASAESASAGWAVRQAESARTVESRPHQDRADSSSRHQTRAEVMAMETCQVGDVASSIGDAVIDPETGEGRAVLLVSARWAAVRCLLGARPDRVAFIDAEGAALRTSVTFLDAAGGAAGAADDPQPVTLDVEHPAAIDLHWHGVDTGSAQGSPAVHPAFLHVWLPGLDGPVGGRWEHGPVYNTGVIEIGPLRQT
ncbi:hypothetical protein [Actinoalloteichus fjordicus]|uniref:Uncharacterized protein n=1 Tax=Actinoalloteichus fjordicus TaxID=1612552 RepID=A0AAC9LGG8_9PSEU|nr:hypothetical protein [Actinoalloteichus fjordicus]APU17493.1 hypothetical protein UA74_27450 [Actinoalloteichus fjordicus]